MACLYNLPYIPNIRSVCGERDNCNFICNWQAVVVNLQYLLESSAIMQGFPVFLKLQSSQLFKPLIGG